MTPDGQRVVVLGGGMAGLAAAWRLSDPVNSDRVASVTLYQRGFRLGGKGASSRGVHGRIEEHGLHVWLGYYDNAFRLVRDVYDELDREHTDPDCPIRTWRDAFGPAPAIGLMTPHDDGDVEPWVAWFAENDRVPGDLDADGVGPLELLQRALGLALEYVRSLDRGPTGAGRLVLSGSPVPPSTGGPSVASLARRGLDTALALALQAVAAVDGFGAALPVRHPVVDGAMSALGRVTEALAHLVEVDPERRRVAELVDLVVTTVRGILADGLLTRDEGFAAVNDEEYRDWLLRHALRPATLRSPLVTGIYDLVFGYTDGDPARASFAAGTALYLGTKMFFDYKGALFWKMQAGMGDVVMAPLYEALQRRGVRIELLHELVEVEADHGHLLGVRLRRQVDLAEGIEAYDPIVRVHGLPCFSDRLDTDQVAGGAGGSVTHLESVWSNRSAAEPDVVLERGRDFDTAVLAVSVGIVPHVAPGLVATDPRWAAMCAEVRTTPTQGVQLWLTADEVALGTPGVGTTVTGAPKPFDTFSSMSHLVATEDWPADATPHTCVYLCATMPGIPPSAHDADHPVVEHRAVRDRAERFLAADATRFLPGAMGPDGFRWDLLVDTDDGIGSARLDAQHWTANVDPSDRYVLSVPGSHRARLRPDESGVDGLVLAGDWVDCGLNAGCIEAATVSGTMAANAVLGDPRWARVVGHWRGIDGT